MLLLRIHLLLLSRGSTSSWFSPLLSRVHLSDLVNATTQLLSLCWQYTFTSAQHALEPLPTLLGEWISLSPDSPLCHAGPAQDIAGDSSHTLPFPGKAAILLTYSLQSPPLPTWTLTSQSISVNRVFIYRLVAFTTTSISLHFPLYSPSPSYHTRIIFLLFQGHSQPIPNPPSLVHNQDIKSQLSPSVQWSVTHPEGRIAVFQQT